ncbi:MAG: MATE family efflux transporter [Prevotella sp.]|nr:MATE family efflux transporter [Prevotella sp.]MDD7047382.1 MATE family efflux transporter [Prevotella sp.]MDY5547602.1 MATE family efflux transporter [Prevotella sp.]
MKRDNYTFLTHAPVHRVVLTMAIPTIISMLSTSLYNLADTYFVGKINTQSTAAVGVSFSVMAIIQAVGFFFGHGSGNYISRMLGAKERELAEQMASTGFVLSIVAGVIIAVLGQLFLTPLCIALGSTSTILPYTERYLGIVMLGAPFMTASLTLNNQMRFQGNASYAMCGILSGVVLNFVLAPLLILYFALGITGAAIATLTSQTFGFLMLFRMSRRSQNISIHISNVRFSRDFMKEIVFGGTPSLSRQGLGSLSTIMLNHAAGFYGDAAIAGMSIVTRLSFFIYAVVIGIGQGFQPLCGFCYGAKLYSRVREGFFFCVKLGTAFLSVCAILGFIFSEPIIALFRDDPDVVAVGAVALDWQIISYPLVTTIVATNMMMQTIRKPVRANLVAAARSGLFFIPLIFILPHFFGLLGVEMCQAWSDVCAFSLSLPIAFSAFRDMRAQ